MTDLRTLTPDDWALWRELRLAALTEAPHAFGAALADWQGPGDTEERWRARLSIPGGHDVVALLHDVAVGMASGVPADAPDTVELISMWVSPAGRGAGVGQALIEAIESAARAGGARQTVLSVMSDNAPATALYERTGYRPTGERRGDGSPGARHEVVLAKDLSTPGPGSPSP